MQIGGLVVIIVTMKLIHGDSLIEMVNLPDNSVDIAFTSPPYNRKRNDKYSHYDDTIKDYYSFLKKSIDEMIRISKGNVFVNIQKNYYNKTEVFEIIGEYSEQLCDIIIWNKSNPMPASGFNITNAYEFILVFGKNLKSNRTYTKNHFETGTARMHKEHKAVMHKAAAEYIIKNFTKESDVIFDPFMGLGTTGTVCMENNREFIGIELNEIYFNIAKDLIWQRK